ncbi:phosphomannose isomerase type II C-terminal cupin domain [Christiangramia echinicola]|uniref:phosphomannose isomerase type II C-terminal cupin domain n=1 Tax=Christiangramia echinicola TaxID=279359 RepID=UPI001FCBAB2C|nr:phosphomannose isomerase type II C-terminal cupin domain [Christiangramia echinicola]
MLEDTDTHKVKKIKVNPGGKLSYQFHHKRAEIWTIVKGVGRVTLEGAIKDYHPGEVVQIPLMAKHRIQNPGEEELEFVEVQHGTYFGEDDIVRIEDDYNRK